MIINRIKGMSVQSKAAIIFTICTFICKGISFISLPFFTRILTTEEIGIVTTFNSWQVLLIVIANLSLDSGSFNIAMMEYKGERYKYMSSILFLSTMSTLFVTGIYFVFRYQFFDLSGLNSKYMMLMLIGFWFTPATSFWMLHQRYEYRYVSTALVTVFSTLGSTLLSLYMVYYNKRQGGYDLAYTRLLYSNGVLIIFGLFFYILILMRGRTGFNKKYWKFVFCTNTPLLFHGLAKNILDVSDRTMIAKICGNKEVGIYGVLYSLSAIALIIWSAINSTLIPYMFESLKSDMDYKVHRIVQSMMVVYSIVCICMTLISPEIVMILGANDYKESVYLMPPMAAGIFFISLYNVYSNLLLYYKKTNYIMYATIIAAVFNVVTNYIFIRMFGYQAAVYTTLFSYIILAVMQYVMLRKVLSGRNILNNRRLWIIAMFTCGFCIITNVLYKYLIIRYIVLFLFIAGLFLNRKKIISLFNER